jgi:4'-phosphopantetheinyl transferase EntD
MEASQAAQQELRQHGLEIEKRQCEEQAQAVQKQIAAQQQQEQTGLEHAAAVQQADQSHVQALQQLAAQPPKPTGAI